MAPLPAIIYLILPTRYLVPGTRRYDIIPGAVTAYRYLAHPHVYLLLPLQVTIKTCYCRVALPPRDYVALQKKPLLVPLAAETHSLSHRDGPCHQLLYCSRSPRRCPWHSPGRRPGRCPCPYHASPKSCDGESPLVLLERVLRLRETDSSAVLAACFPGRLLTLLRPPPRESEIGVNRGSARMRAPCPTN